MDIFEYPSALSKLEQELTKLRNEKDILEITQRNKKAEITGEIDKIPYKSAAIRENFIILQLANTVEYVTIETRMNEILAQLRVKTDEHIKLRREFRLLELEYNAHGIRNFQACGQK